MLEDQNDSESDRSYDRSYDRSFLSSDVSVNLGEIETDTFNDK